jgi:hypothetical protein
VAEVRIVGKKEFEDIFNTLHLRKPEGHSDDSLVGIYLSGEHKYLEFEGEDRKHSFIEYKAEA